MWMRLIMFPIWHCGDSEETLSPLRLIANHKACRPWTCPFPHSLGSLSEPRFLFITRFVRLSQDKDLKGSWLGPEPRKSFSRPNRKTGGTIPAQPLGKPERRPDPRLSQPLLLFRRSTNWASSPNPQQPFWRCPGKKREWERTWKWCPPGLGRRWGEKDRNEISWLRKGSF